MVKRKATPKGAGKGNKSSKFEKEYAILTMEEQEARDAKYAMRLADLRTCLSFVDGKWGTIATWRYIELQVKGFEK